MDGEPIMVARPEGDPETSFTPILAFSLEGPPLST